MKVALLCNQKPASLHAGSPGGFPGGFPDELPDDAFEEYDDPATIRHVARALTGLGVTVEAVEGDQPKNGS